MTSDTEDETLPFAEEIDVLAADSYSDASRRVNYEVTAEGSSSSFELYYRGISDYRYGMGVFQVVYKNNKSMEDALTVTDWSDAVLTMKVKNPNAFSVKLGLSIIVLDANNNQKWLDDFGAAHIKEISAGSDWVTVEWELKGEYGITENNIQRIGLKASADQNYVDTELGYDMTLYFDDMDIKNNDASSGTDIHIGAEQFENASHKYYWIAETSVGSTIAIDFKFDEQTDGNCLTFRLQKQWGAGDVFFGDYQIKLDSTKELGAYIVGNSWFSDNAGTTLTKLEDGWYRITIDMSIAGQGTAYTTLPSGTIDCIFITPGNDGTWVKGNGQIKFIGTV